MDLELSREDALFREEVRDWLARQFDELGSRQSEDLAMDMLARMQGVSVMCCAFKDMAFLERSLNDIRDWLGQQLRSLAH